MALPSQKDVDDLIRQHPNVEITIPSRGTTRATEFKNRRAELLAKLAEIEAETLEINAELNRLDDEPKDQETDHGSH